ncbi:uncharacterized protein TNCT_59361 [Trichonephila clavata]|uniref:Uncharacterized protein n=1 Tax=Trichonephila clavata TaxID=2740835 RepID=A0A8X6M3Q7_TRICU|nr:uncharacterized protein TNCT_59361 [Trichonephila clavata]
MVEHIHCVTPLLTLKEINNSQEEMTYLTRMRNVIKFQTARPKEYEYFKNNNFYNEIFCHKEHEPSLEACLSHALTKVVKSHLMVDNLVPFLQWDIVDIDADGFTEGQNPVTPRENADPRAVEYAQGNPFLVAAFSNFNILDFNSVSNSYSNERNLITCRDIVDLQINDVVYLNSLHKSSWRRVFDRGLALFSCCDQDIAAYVREQTKISKPMKVFKQILNRELGERFDQFDVLESIASPYYYVLPHQNENEYKSFELFCSWFVITDTTSYISYCFESSLIIGAKTLV